MKNPEELYEQEQFNRENELEHEQVVADLQEQLNLSRNQNEELNKELTRQLKFKYKIRNAYQDYRLTLITMNDLIRVVDKILKEDVR